MAKKDPNIIRVGDRVKVVKPDFFVRCGYPLTIDMVKDQIREEHTDRIQQLIREIVYVERYKVVLGGEGYDKSDLFTFKDDDKIINKVVNALAYDRLGFLSFGGRERKIYTESKPDDVGREYVVKEVLFVVTGTYYAPSGGYSYEGDWDYDPGGLDNSKTHKILGIAAREGAGYDYPVIWEDKKDKKFSSYNTYIEASNVEKVHEPESIDTLEKLKNA